MITTTPIERDMTQIAEATEVPDSDLLPGLLRADLVEATRNLGRREAGALVSAYYQMQDDRIRRVHQRDRLGAAGEQGLVLDWAERQAAAIEATLRKALDYYGRHETSGMAMWARDHHGIGPVIGAGLVAHIDIERAPTAGHIWSFAGLNPEQVWSKGTKRPWNARLKVLCFKIGESFMRQSGSPKCFYGHLYLERKALELARNAAGLFAEQAKTSLAKNLTDHQKEFYEKGLLVPGRIDLRARRWAVKIFLSHYHAEAYRRFYGVEPPAPYPIAHLGHAHMVRPGVP